MAHPPEKGVNANLSRSLKGNSRLSPWEEVLQSETIQVKFALFFKRNQKICPNFQNLLVG